MTGFCQRRHFLPSALHIDFFHLCLTCAWCMCMLYIMRNVTDMSHWAVFLSASIFSLRVFFSCVSLSLWLFTFCFFYVPLAHDVCVCSACIHCLRLWCLSQLLKSIPRGEFLTFSSLLSCLVAEMSATISVVIGSGVADSVPSPSCICWDYVKRLLFFFSYFLSLSLVPLPPPRYFAPKGATYQSSSASAGTATGMYRLIDFRCNFVKKKMSMSSFFLLVFVPFLSWHLASTSSCPITIYATNCTSASRTWHLLWFGIITDCSCILARICVWTLTVWIFKPPQRISAACFPTEALSLSVGKKQSIHRQTFWGVQKLAC